MYNWSITLYMYISILQLAYHNSFLAQYNKYLSVIKVKRILI